MTNSLEHLLDLRSYSPTAVEKALASPLAEAGPDFLIIRLIAALDRNDLATAAGIVSAFDDQPPVGYVAFQAWTVAMVIAARRGDDAGFARAFARWKQGGVEYPGNWDASVLDCPDIARRLSPRDRDAAFAPPAHRQTKITRAERAMIADPTNARLRAVQDNLQWLRETGTTASAETLARRYRLAAVDTRLREIWFHGRGDLPDLVVSLDEKGDYAGSFIAH